MCDLSTLLGLSKTIPSCFTDTAPSGYNQSGTGYFINDPEYGVQFFDSCEIAGWALLSSAKTDAVRDFQVDLSNAMYTQYEKAYAPFSGVIGKVSKSGYLTPTKNNIGQKMTFPVRRGMSLVLKGVRVGLSVTGTYTLTITSTAPDFTPVTRDVNSEGGNFGNNTFSTVIELPMYTDFLDEVIDDGVIYWLTIDRAGALPINSMLVCCGNTGSWSQLFDVEGLVATGVNGEGAETSQNTNGLVFDAYIKCDDLAWICDLEEMGGYETKRVVGRALQFRAASIAIGAMLSSNHISQCTLYNMEQMNKHRNFLNTKYGEYIDWIVQSIPIGATSCIQCKQENIFNKASILT